VLRKGYSFFRRAVSSVSARARKPSTLRRGCREVASRASDGLERIRHSNCFIGSQQLNLQARNDPACLQLSR